MSAGGAGLALREDTSVELPPGKGVTVFFTVPDLHAYHDRLVAKGVTVVEPIHDMPFGPTFTISTPDGHWLGFWQGE